MLTFKPASSGGGSVATEVDKIKSEYLEATAVRSATEWQLTSGAVSESHTAIVRFLAPANYVKGDTLSVNSAPYTLTTLDGKPLPEKAWATGAVVTLALNPKAKTAFFKAGGADLPTKTIKSVAATSTTLDPAMTALVSTFNLAPHLDGRKVKYMSGFMYHSATSGNGYIYFGFQQTFTHDTATNTTHASAVSLVSEGLETYKFGNFPKLEFNGSILTITSGNRFNGGNEQYVKFEGTLTDLFVVFE